MASSAPRNPMRDQDTSAETPCDVEVNRSDTLQAASQVAEDQQDHDTRDVNYFHNIKIGDDVDHIMISTSGQSFDARDITVGDRARDWSGQMSDETVQQLSRARMSATSINEGTGQGRTLERQYGEGRRLG